MKLLACDICQDVIVSAQLLRSCACGNIQGRYQGDRVLEYRIRDKSKGRILGISNAVRYGMMDTGRMWVITNPEWIVEADDFFGMGWSLEQVRSLCARKGEFTKFKKWISGQTCPMTPKGEILFYKHDVVRFLEQEREGKSTYFD